MPSPSSRYATPAELDENRYQIDRDRYRRQGMDAEQARLAVDWDNPEASIRAGLLRGDARQIVDGMTDAQVTALCPDGNPPSLSSGTAGRRVSCGTTRTCCSSASRRRLRPYPA